MKWATPLFALCVLGAAEILEGDILVRHGLDDAGTGDEHVARPLDHEDEVGDGGGVDGAPGARPEDGRYLRDDPRGEGVAEEDFGVTAQRLDALLDPRAARSRSVR